MRSQPHVLATRVTTAQRAVIMRRCREYGLTPAALLRGAVHYVSRGLHRAAQHTLTGNDSDDHDKALARLIDFLGLDPSASAADVINAVTALLEPPAADGAPPPLAGAGATGGAADVSKDPAKVGGFGRRRTTKAEEESAYCKRHGITRQEFEARKRAAVRTAKG